MLKSIEERYESAIEQITPNVLDDILAQDVLPMQEEDDIIRQEPEKKSRRKTSTYVSVIGVAVAAMLLLFLYNRSVVETSITIDVNPSFEIQLNKDEEVKKVIGINADGKEMVEQADFKDKNLEHTVEELMRVIDENGYFKKKSAVLVSVQNKKETTAQSMEKKVKKQIKKVCEISKTKPVVYTQSVRNDKEIEEVAKNYHISKGRATFICNMVKQDSEWKVEELASMSIEELVSCAKEKGLKVSDILEKKPKKKVVEETEKAKQKSISSVTATPNNGEVEKKTKSETTKDVNTKNTVQEDTKKKNDKNKVTSKDTTNKKKKTEKKDEESTQQSDSESEKNKNKQKGKKKDKDKDKDKEQEATPQPTPTAEPETEEEVEETPEPDDKDWPGKDGPGKDGPGRGGRR